MQKLFGTDGIRGQANVYPMNSETALLAGKAVASYFKNKSDHAKQHIVIGQDTRLSGDMLVNAFAAGVCAVGVDVWPSGVLPTPGIAHLARSTGALAGIVISASHNPYEDNGIKIFDAHGFKLSDAVEAEIEVLLKSNSATVAASDRIGQVKRFTSATEHYLNFLQEAVKEQSFSKISVVLDCANGATYRAAPKLFRRLGCRVTPLFCAPDGININDHCGSQHPESLADRVVAEKADLGFAFDGDGDRLIAVDETGRVLSGDQIMAICARDLMRKGQLKNTVVVSTVMSNLGFGAALKEMGIRLHTTQVGDRYVMEKMRLEDAVLGGEDSGHMIFRDVHTTGDGVMAAVRLLEVMNGSGQPLSALADVMTVFPQELINVDVSAKPALESIPEITGAIARIEEQLGERGRVLVRYSGTQNKCRVMVEGPDAVQTRAHCVAIADAVRRALNP